MPYEVDPRVHSEPFFTAQGLCAIFGIDRKVFEAAVREQLVPTSPVKRGAVRKFNFWEALDVGIFGDLMNQGIARRHASRIAFHFDFSPEGNLATRRRDLWLIARPAWDRGSGDEDQHPGFEI